MSAAGFLLGMLAACSPEPAEETGPPLPVNPTPSEPGQVVVLAGNGKEGTNPRDGEYAVRTSIKPVGGVAVGPDGSVYFVIQVGPSDRVAQVARLTPDGLLKLLPNGRLPFLANGAQLAVGKTDVWLFDTDGFGELRAIPLDGRSSPRDPLLSVFTRDVDAFGLRWDGVPIIATKDWELYEVLDGKKFRRWIPAGYTAALKRMRDQFKTFGSVEDLNPQLLSEDRSHNLYLIGDGIVKIPRRGKAQTITEARKYGGSKNLSGGIILRDRSILLASQQTPPVTVIRSEQDMRFSEVQLGNGRECTVESFDRLRTRKASLHWGKLHGLAQKPDGTIVTAACNHLFGIRLSEN